VDKSMELMEEAEKLKLKKAAAANKAAALAKQAEGDTSSVNAKLRVCEVCGAMLSIFDSDRFVYDVCL